MLITINTLENFIKNLDNITSKARELGYENVGLFRAPFEEEKDTVFLMGTYRPEAKALTFEIETINQALTKLLDCPVSFWSEGAERISKCSKEEAKLNLLSNREETAKYFLGTIIPYSTDYEPIGEDYKYVAQLVQKHYGITVPTTSQKRKHVEAFTPQFFNSNLPSSNEAQSAQLPESTKTLLNQVISTLGNESGKWEALEEYIQSQKKLHLRSPHIDKTVK